MHHSTVNIFFSFFPYHNKTPLLVVFAFDTANSLNLGVAPSHAQHSTGLNIWLWAVTLVTLVAKLASRLGRVSSSSAVWLVCYVRLAPRRLTSLYVFCLRILNHATDCPNYQPNSLISILVQKSSSLPRPYPATLGRTVDQNIPS